MLLLVSIWISIDFYGHPYMYLLWIPDPGYIFNIFWLASSCLVSDERWNSRWEIPPLRFTLRFANFARNETKKRGWWLLEAAGRKCSKIQAERRQKEGGSLRECKVTFWSAWLAEEPFSVQACSFPGAGQLDYNFYMHSPPQKYSAVLLRNSLYAKNLVAKIALGVKFHS